MYLNTTITTSVATAHQLQHHCTIIATRDSSPPKSSVRISLWTIIKQ